MRRAVFLLLLAAGLPLAARGQPLAPLQQNPVERVAPTPVPRVAPALQAPPLLPQTGPGAAQRLQVAEVSFAGNGALSAGQLRAAVAALPGQEVTLAQIDEARIAIVSAYRRAGHSFASVDAGVTRRPDGRVDIAFQVTEGFIAEVKLDGDIGPAGTQALRFLEPLTRARPISAAALERALLLVSDIPGVTVRGLVRPLPNEPGALQLVAQLRRRPFGGYLGIDNRASDFAGPWQGLLAVGANSFTSLGERTELALFGAQDSTQQFAQGTIEGFVGGSGLRLRLWGGAGQAQPGSTLAAIGYRGDTQVFGGALTYPLVRQRPFSLFATAQFDAFGSVVKTDSGGGATRASRDDIRTLRAGFDMQALDSYIPFLPAGTTIGNLRIHQGLPWFGATTNDDPLSSRAGSRYDFTKVSFELQRTQPVFEPLEGWIFGVQGLIAGQYSGDVLPSVEKFFLGGARLNRGYYAGQVTGDQGFSYAVELQLSTRFDLPFETPWGTPGVLDAQLYLFRDQGWTRENAPFDPNRSLASYGIGLRFELSQTIAFDIEGVRRETRRPLGQAAAPLDSDAIFFRTLIRF